MAKASVEFRTRGAEELRALSTRLRDLSNGDLKKELTKGIRAAGKPAVRDVKRAAKAVEVTSSRGGTKRTTGLRKSVARSTGMSVRQTGGIRIEVSKKKMSRTHGKYGAALSKYLDSTPRGYARWRHPVFGQEDVWSVQFGKPYFYNTLNHHEARFRGGVVEAMESIKRQIGG